MEPGIYTAIKGKYKDSVIRVTETGEVIVIYNSSWYNGLMKAIGMEH